MKDSTCLKIEVEIEMEGTPSHLFESGLFVAVLFVAFLQVFFTSLVNGLFSLHYIFQVLVGLRLTVIYLLSGHIHGRHSTVVQWTSI